MKYETNSIHNRCEEETYKYDKEDKEERTENFEGKERLKQEDPLSPILILF